MNQNQIFDYIIVGAGSAGCPLANRLTEDGRHTVALLEAGGNDRHPFIRMPAGMAYLWGNPKFDWCYKSEPDPTRNGRVEAWPRGRLLGGSSSVNGLLFVRGQPEDYDDWASSGATGWSFADLLPFFKRMESTSIGSAELRGRGGPLKIVETWANKNLTDIFIAACEENQIPANADYNGRSQDGVGLSQTNQIRGERCSAADAFLRSARRRPNLSIFTHANMTRILLDGKRAMGVECEINRVLKNFSCRKEIILSAGAINSPQLLMLSGIGPGDELKKLGISVTHDLRGVGSNLMEHPVISQQRAIRLPTLNREAQTHRLIANVIRWTVARTGPIAAAGSQAVAFLKSKPSLDRPDLQLMFGAVSYSQENGAIRLAKENGVSIHVNVSRPKSRGRISLRSNDPRVAPMIEPKLLDDRADLDCLIRGARIVENIFDAPAFRKVISENQQYLPIDDVEMERFVRDNSGIAWHPSGTCKMGTDAASVVDPKLRVHGIVGLRVADASIFPSLVSGNTNAAAIVVGEKAADLIRER